MYRTNQSTHPYLLFTGKTSSSAPSHSDPETWGPAFWFTLHNSAVGYPEYPTTHVKHQMKSFIVGIPVMVPCEKCYHHALEYINSRQSDMDSIVSSQKNLFNFFVDFHNEVNKRNDKKQFTYAEAWEMYKNNTYTKRFTYS